MKTYDLVVIGGGPGGYVAAIKAAQLNAKVALIEKEVVGGICLNHGCIPTKTLLKNAKVYNYIKHAKAYGVTIDGDVSVNWKDMLKRKDQVVKKLTMGVGGLLKKNGVDVYQGLAEVLSSKKVKVNDETLETKNLIIATGASPIVPPIPGLKEGLDSGFVVRSRELLQVEAMPKKLVVIGGGVIGIEFATMFQTLGVEVTVIEKMDGILPMMDEDIRQSYTKVLKKDGVNIFANASVDAVNKDGVTYTYEGKSFDLKADLVLLSVGMKANTQGLEALNLTIERGAIVTNDVLETNIDGVYAIGDVNGKFMLAHVASAEGLVVAENLFSDHSPKMNYSRIPNAVYGFPEIASIGLTEKEAKEQGLDYKVSTFPLLANGRALAENEKDGFVKLIVSNKYKEVIGAHILGYNASEMIAEIGLAIELEGTAYEIASTIHPHPTVSEMIMEAAHGAIDKPIHF